MKRAWKAFPKMFLQALAFIAVVGAIAFCAVKLMYREQPAISIRAAVVAPDGSGIADMALPFLEALELGCEFVFCQEEEAFSLLNSGKENVAAVIVLPPKIVEDIMNGADTSVQIYLKDNLNAASGLLKELAGAGAKLLTTAQAEIYTITDLAKKYGRTGNLPEWQQNINLENLDLAFNRQLLIKVKEVNPTGSVSVKTYYTASAIAALLLLLGIPMGVFLKTQDRAIQAQLIRAGCGRVPQTFAKLAAAFSIHCAFSMIFPAAFGLLGMELAFSPSYFVILLSIDTFILLMYKICSGGNSGVYLLSCLTVLLLFLAGGIVPFALLPEIFQKAAAFNPVRHWLIGIAQVLEGEAAGRLFPTVIWSVLFFLGGAALCRE